jgi:hypothetical protein
VKKNPLIPKIPRVPNRPRMPKVPAVPMPMNGPTQAPPDLGQGMPPNPISQGKIQIGGFNPKKGGMF